jgi:dienelactone hydrolase
MALRDSKGAAAYLGRPCQYVHGVDARQCEKGYWTNRRFAPEVIEATSLAIDELKKTFKASKVVLVGYSGGGAVAALVAASRDDVVQLVTVAGNLDHRAWTTLHHVPPLAGSLNPPDAWPRLQSIPQLHLVGGMDPNVSELVVNAYADKFSLNLRPKVKVVAGFDHTCCWVDEWPQLSRDVVR